MMEDLPLYMSAQNSNGTCDVVLFEGVAVDLVLIGAVLPQPFAHVLLGPEGHRFGQLHISRLFGRKHEMKM